MKAPTVKDIAKLAKVSIATVSLVLNGHDGRISDATKERINTIARELNYQPNSLAQSLRNKKSDIIGLIVPSVTNPFYPAIAKGVEETAELYGFTVLLCNSHNDPIREEKYIRILLQKRVAGIIITSKPDSAIDYSIINSNPEIKTLSFVRNPYLLNADHLLVDNVLGGYLATSHLIELGHKKIAYIGRPMRRLDGYKKALLEKGLNLNPDLIAVIDKEVDEVDGNEYISYGDFLTAGLIERHPDLTAVVAFNDLVALGSLNAVKTHGLRVPEDISIIGYDDNPFAFFADPPLTTIKQPRYERGRDAVIRLIERINGQRNDAIETIYQPELILRNSTGPASIS